MGYEIYVAIKSKKGHVGIIAHDFWKTIVQYKISQATDFEFRMWSYEKEGLEIARKYGTKTKNDTTDEIVYKGKASEQFKEEILNNYLTTEGNLKWFMVNLESNGQTILCSEHNGAEIIIHPICKAEKYELKALFADPTLLEKFPEIDYFHILGRKDQWHTIQNDTDINNFLQEFGGFHDACIKELHYISGAYVEENLSMNPENYNGKVSIIFQRQVNEIGTLELEFSEGVQININTSNQQEYGLLLDAFIGYIDGVIYWADYDGWTPQLSNKNDSTWFAAKNARWRILEDCLGADSIYRMDVH